MNTYYYDTDDGSDARLWKRIVCDTITKLQIPVGQREFDPAPGGGVVFIHHSSLPCTETSAHELTSKYPSAIFVWIFGAGIPGGPTGDRYYCVHSNVEKPADEAFSGRVDAFLTDLANTGKPKFALLEPLVIPAELASWALWKQAEAIGMAGDKTRPASLPQDGSEILKDQYRKLAKALSHTPAEWDGLDLACAEVLLKAVNRASVGAI